MFKLLEKLWEIIDFNNKKISAVVDLTDNRIQGILVNAKNLKPYVYGVDYLKTYGMGMLKSKNVKDLTDQDLATIELNLKNQIDQERKVAGKDFNLLKDRQKFLKNVQKFFKIFQKIFKIFQNFQNFSKNFSKLFQNF